MMLDKIYGFENCKVAVTESWIAEEYHDDDIVYTCHVLPDGSAKIILESIYTLGLLFSYDVTSDELSIFLSKDEIRSESEIVHYCFLQFKAFINLVFSRKFSVSDFLTRIDTLTDLMLSCNLISHYEFKILTDYMHYCCFRHSMPYPFNLLCIKLRLYPKMEVACNG